MLIMSLCAMPLAFFDLVFVPTYWQPVTLWNIPIGVEGFLFSFSVGGIAAVIYAELTKRKPQRIPRKKYSAWRAFCVPVLTLVSFILSFVLGIPNPEIAGYIGITVGIISTLYLRPDLARNIPYGMLAFGIVYFVSLKMWVMLFPDVESWFTTEYMPKLFVWGVPGWEALFGFFFGAFWGNLYELLFGYRLVPMTTSVKARSTNVRIKASR